MSEDGKIIGHFTATGLSSFYTERFAQWGYDPANQIYTPVHNGEGWKAC